MWKCMQGANVHPEYKSTIRFFSIMAIVAIFFLPLLQNNCCSFMTESFSARASHLPCMQLLTYIYRRTIEGTKVIFSIAQFSHVKKFFLCFDFIKQSLLPFPRLSQSNNTQNSLYFFLPVIVFKGKQ